MCRYNSHKLCAHTASRCSLHNMRRNHVKHTHGKLGEFCPPIDMNTYFNIQITEQGNSIQDADNLIPLFSRSECMVCHVVSYKGWRKVSWDHTHTGREILWRDTYQTRRDHWETTRSDRLDNHLLHITDTVYKPWKTSYPIAKIASKKYKNNWFWK